MAKDIAVAGGAMPATGQMSVYEVKSRITAVCEIMSNAMVQGTHYGAVIEGSKPTLLKAGAEMLAMTFRLAPEIEVEIKEIEGNGHREYVAKCLLRHITTGQVWAHGIGSCTTLESKYRYREELTETNDIVPAEYWEAKNKKNFARAQMILGGKNFIAKKKSSGIWKIYKKSENKIENPDIADTYNTVLKMAKKRAQVDATLTALSCSHLFTQDLEDYKVDFNDLGGGEDISAQAEILPATEQAAETPTATEENAYKIDLGGGEAIAPVGELLPQEEMVKFTAWWKAQTPQTQDTIISFCKKENISLRKLTVEQREKVWLYADELQEFNYFNNQKEEVF